MFYDYYKQDFFTKNRRLVLEEYDNNGDLIESRGYGEDELAMFISFMNNQYEPLKVARYKHLEQFTEDELKLIGRIIANSELWAMHDRANVYGLNSDEEVQWFKELIKMPKEKIEMALNMSHPHMSGFNSGIGSPYSRMKFTLQEAFIFIDAREGIYYTVANSGKKVWDFVDKPTLKQYRYQVKKNGHRTVFFSFKDWREYIVNESDLV